MSRKSVRSMTREVKPGVEIHLLHSRTSPLDRWWEELTDSAQAAKGRSNQNPAHLCRQPGVRCEDSTLRELRDYVWLIGSNS